MHVSSYFAKLVRVLAVKYPIKARLSPTKLVMRIYITAVLTSPSRKRFKFSRLKEEKVVNPPRMPTKRKTLNRGENSKRSNKPQRKPMTNDPKRFTTRVLVGKTPFENLKSRLETAYLNIPPIALPSAT